MSRSLQEKEKQTVELKRENTELRGQLVAVSMSVSQRQSSTQILGLPQLLADALTVKKAAPEEIETKRIEEQTPTPENQVETVRHRRLDRSKTEDFGVTKFVAQQ